MGRFKGFYTGGEIAEENTDHSGVGGFVNKRKKRESSPASKRQLNVWSHDLSKCSSIRDYQNYIKKYDNPNNPYIIEAKRKRAELSGSIISICKSIENYNASLSSFLSGKNVLRSESAIRKPQNNVTPTNNSDISRYHNSDISGADIWGFIKKGIGVIVILPLIGLIYLCITGEGKWTMVGGYGLFIVTPVCKWAFDS